MALSDDLSRRVGTRTGKGTLITKDLVSRVRADESAILEIQADNTRIIQEAISQAIMRGLEEIGIDCTRIASQNAPFDTGRLSASITHALSEDEKAVYVGTNVEYAAYQELGDSKYAGANGGKGYLRPAATENTDRFRAILKKHLENA